MGTYWPSALWFAAIVVLIPAALWLLKRTPVGGGASGLLRSVAVLPLSASQRLAIVEVGSGTARQWLVLGISAQAISTLHTLAPLDGATPPGAQPSVPFAQLLSRLRRP